MRHFILKKAKTSVVSVAILALLVSFFSAMSIKATGETLVSTQGNVVLGDLNGDISVNSIDFAYLRMYLLGNIKDFPSSNAAKAADVSGDGSINSIDFGYFRMYLLGHIKVFPGETSATPTPVETPSTTPTFSPSSPAPLLEILSEFTASDVPALGPEETKIDSISWSVPNGNGSELPGGGLSRYPMLYIGEGYNKIFLVNEGKVIWTYSTGQGEEYDDVWMMTNGNILYTRQSYVAEVNPQKKQVWRYNAPSGSEIHSAQPIGLDKVLMAVNANPPKLVIINKTTGKVEMEHTLPHEKPQDVHGQFRRVRITDKGTYLVSYLSVGKVVEFDKDFNQIWSYQVRSPWAAIRLKNGNTLISSEKLGLVREVNTAGETVWEFKMSDIPPEYGIPDSQSCVRLDNGNTILCSRGNSGNNPQLIEVTQDKK